MRLHYSYVRANMRVSLIAIKAAAVGHARYFWTTQHKQSTSSKATYTPQKAHQQTNTKKIKSTTYQRSAIRSVRRNFFALCFLFIVLLSQSDATSRLFSECILFGAALSIIFSRYPAHLLNILISFKILIIHISSPSRQYTYFSIVASHALKPSTWAIPCAVTCPIKCSESWRSVWRNTRGTNVVYSASTATSNFARGLI